MAAPKKAGMVPTRKKSVSKASAAAGREDSRAVKVKRDKAARSRTAHQDRGELAEFFKEREHDTDRQRKVHRGEKHK